jgi:hypothetical protein
MDPALAVLDVGLLQPRIQRREMDADVLRDLLQINIRTTVASDPHNVVAELLRIRLRHSDILPAPAKRLGRSVVTYPCSRLIFNTNEVLTDDAYTRWKEQFVDETTGTEIAHKPLLIEGGDAKPYMSNQQDLDFLDSRKFSRDEILVMCKVSPCKLGLVENVNKAFAEMFERKHAKDNTLSRVRQWVRQINNAIVSVFDPAYQLGFENPNSPLHLNCRCVLLPLR